MGESRKCWLDAQKACECNADSECTEMFARYAKVVWCQDKECLWNVQLPSGEHFVDRGKTIKPWADDGFAGICSRKELALSPMNVAELKTKRVLTTCRVRSDKSLNEPHMPDADKIQGGSISDPHSADWSHSAYGRR